MIKIKALVRSKDRDSLPWTQAQCSAGFEGSVVWGCSSLCGFEERAGKPSL